MNIREALTHPWIHKFCKSQISEMRRKSSYNVSDFKFFSSVDAK